MKTSKKVDITAVINNEFIPQDKEKYKINLRNFYDTMNHLFQRKEFKDLFYTEKELKLLQKSKPELFI